MRARLTPSHPLHTLRDCDGAVFAGAAAEVVAEYSSPLAGTKYVEMSQVRTRFRKWGCTSKTSPKS